MWEVQWKRLCWVGFNVQPSDTEARKLPNTCWQQCTVCFGANLNILIDCGSLHLASRNVLQLFTHFDVSEIDDIIRARLSGNMVRIIEL